MTISSSTRYITYNGNNSTTIFTFPFKVFATSELVIYLQDNLSGIQTLQVLGTDYTAVLSAAQNSNPGGSVTFILAAPVVGKTIIITSNIALEQPTNLSNQGGFYPEVINNSLDRATIQIQQVANLGTRSLVVPITESGTDLELPTATERALKYLIFDGTGKPALASFTGGTISNSTLTLLANVASTSPGTGTLTLTGVNAGIGITGAMFIGSTLAATATVSSGALNVAGGGYFASTCFINGMVVGNALNTGGTFPTLTTAIGVDANLTCSNNTARATIVGHSAGKTTTSQGGVDMTAIGYRALQGNTTTQCTAVGASAGYAGVANVSVGLTAVGYNAGTQASGSGAGITVVGADAASGLTGTTTGLTAIGWNAAKSAVGAQLSTAVGYEALLNSSTTGCTAVGYAALKQATAGVNGKSNSTAVGNEAGRENTGANVTIVGSSSGVSNAASGLIAIGVGAATGVSSGATQSIYIGNSSGALAAGTTNIAVGGSTLGSSATRCVAIGHQVGQNPIAGCARNTYVGYQIAQGGGGADNVAIGDLAIGDPTGISAAANENVAVGHHGLYSLTTGANNTCVGSSAGRQITTGSRNIYVGKDAGFNGAGLATLSDVILIGQGEAGNLPTASGQMILGQAATVSARIYGVVHQGTTDPAISAASGTLGPTQSISRVTVTGAVATITVPWSGAFAGNITLIPIVAFTTTTAGNIAVASTAVVNKPLVMTWSSATSKWYPSY